MLKRHETATARFWPEPALLRAGNLSLATAVTPTAVVRDALRRHLSLSSPSAFQKTDVQRGRPMKTFKARIPGRHDGFSHSPLSPEPPPERRVYRPLRGSRIPDNRR
jgi:hypothetical protein